MKDAALAAATEAASEVLSEDLGIFAEAPDTGEQTEPEAVTEIVAVEEVDPFAEVELPEDIRELVEVPDFEAEAETEVESFLVSQAQEVDEEFDIENEWDPEKKDILKRLYAAEKKAQFYEEKRAEEATKNWSQEAEKFFPYADVSKIKATSRRAFLRAAKAEHDSRKAENTALAEKLRPKIESEIKADLRAQIEAEVRAELKEQTAQAWGSPTVNVTTGAQGVTNDERFNKVMRSRGLAAALRDSIKA